MPPRVAFASPLVPALALASLLALALAGCATTPGGNGGSAKLPPGTRSDMLDRAYAQFWDESLALNPLQATFQGDGRYNDQLPDFLGPAYRKRAHDFNARWLKKIQSIGDDGLSGEDRISYAIFVHDARLALDGEQFPSWQLPINQFYNVANLAVALGSGNGAQPFRTVEDYDNWRKRAARFPAIFDQAIANMRAGVAKGVVQPRALMTSVVPQLDAIIKDTPEATVFWSPVKTMPPAFSEADTARITADYRQLIAQQLLPAYRRLRDYIANDYLPHTRAGLGIGALPGGAAWYAYDVRQNTGTDLTPAQVRQMGLDEVARLQDEIRALMQQVHFKGSLQAFFRYMREDPRFAVKDAGALLARYRAADAQVGKHLSKLFAQAPATGLEVRMVAPYRAKSAPAVEYRPARDGGKADLYVNTDALANRRTWEVQPLYLHEGVPGHHLQMSLQQQLHDLPRFRRYGGETAFAEGWAVYAESLGGELGLYTDPYDRFGYLHSQLWRALRLVAETGLHDRGWSRERVIGYLLDNSAATPAEADAEVQRYMAVPGQALAYAVGAMRITALRDQARQALGADFDIRQFHAQVLDDGSMPLDVLSAKIDRWIDARTGGAATAAKGDRTKPGQVAQ